MLKFVDIPGMGAACIMEKCLGVALSKYLAKSEFSEEEVESLSSQLAEMLRSFRECGVAHRDFGTYNIIRCDDGILKAVDFQNSITLEGHDTLADICLSRKSLYFLYSNIGCGCGTFNDYALLRRGLPMLLATALDKTIGEDVSHFDFHCPLPFKVIFHCFWNFPACIIRSWFLRKNLDAKKKALEKIAAMKMVMHEAKDRISGEGFKRGLQNTRRYVEL
jgi:serine/threonine protein kinase